MSAHSPLRIIFFTALIAIGAHAVSFGGCHELLDTLPTQEEPADNGADGEAVEKDEFEIKPPVHTAFLFGFGIGYARHPGFNRLSYDFFSAFLWEVWRYGAIRAAGQIAGDFDEALAADATAGFNVYPFTYGTTPYLGIEVGYGYARTETDDAFGPLGAVEIGVFAVKISTILFTSSARVAYFRTSLSGEYPLLLMLRIGIIV